MPVSSIQLVARGGSVGRGDTTRLRLAAVSPVGGMTDKTAARTETPDIAREGRGSWYHATMTKNITVRLPDELAADAEALARVEGTSLNETVKRSLLEAVERRRKSPQFKARLTKIIEEDRELLERLAR